SPAVGEIRAGHQPQNREGTWPHRSAVAACYRRRGDRMKRREFITLLGGAAAAWPLGARGQQPAMPVIGYFSGRSADTEEPLRKPSLRALEELGFAGGRNVEIEYRFSQGQDARLPSLASELVSRKVTMLVATDSPSALAARAATATIPIVFTSGFDPVQLGL